MNQQHLAYANYEIDRRLADAASRRRARLARRPRAARRVPSPADGRA